MSLCFPQPYERFGGNVEIELYLSNYETKADWKGAEKSDLPTLKAQVDKLDVDKLKTVPTDFVKLSNVAHNIVAKKIVSDKLVPNVSATNTRY